MGQVFFELVKQEFIHHSTAQVITIKIYSNYCYLLLLLLFLLLLLLLLLDNCMSIFSLSFL